MGSPSPDFLFPIKLLPEAARPIRRGPIMNLTNAPVLVTKNLTLRGPQKSDLPALTQFVGSERMEKFDGFEGKSLCYEAAVAVRAWAGSLGLSPLISMIVPNNTRSLVLAARLGAIEESRKQHDGEEAILLHHLAHDHPAAQAQLAEVTP